MFRRLAASAAAVAVLAIGAAAPATADTSGMAAEFPVGTCVELPFNHLINVDGAIQIVDDLIHTTVVPCTDPDATYRVTAQVLHDPQCSSTTNKTYTTRDVVVLCMVQV